MKECQCTDSGNKFPVFAPGDAPEAPSSDTVYREMNRLAGAYPFVTLSEYGRSVMGKPLLADFGISISELKKNPSAAIRAAGLPGFYADRLETGR